MHTFATMTAIRMDREYQKMFYLFGCAAIVAEIAVNLPYEALFEWVDSSHLCLPVETLKHKDKAEVMEKTIFKSLLNQQVKS